jgi:Calpain family cysteine protease
VSQARTHEDASSDQADSVRPESGAAASAAATVQALQRSAGNRAVARLLARETTPTGESEPALVDPVPKELVDELKDPDNSVYGVKMPITVELLDLLTPGSYAKKDKREKPEGGGKYAYTKFSGAAFVKGQDDAGTADTSDIDPNDVKQGQLGDCYLLASMAAIARANPEAIRKLVSGPNSDGTFNVTIYSDTGGAFSTKWTPKVVKVTPTFPSFTSGAPAFAERGDIDPAQGGPELWVMLIEKAYATVEGGYGDIEGGYGRKAMTRLTGVESKSFDPDDYTDVQIVATIKYYLSAKWAVTASADWYARDAYKNEARKKGIVLEHEYAVVSVDEARKTIDLQNPWGDEHIKGLAMSEFRTYFREVAANPLKKK